MLMIGIYLDINIFWRYNCVKDKNLSGVIGVCAFCVITSTATFYYVFREGDLYMHELLKEYISKKEAEKNKKIEKEKNEYLILHGLYEKVYAETDVYDPSYAFEEIDEDTKTYKRFNKVPIEISDSEYKYLLELDEPKKTNTIASILTVIAWITFIGGFIAGIVLGRVEADSYYSYTEFSFAVALIYWGVSFLSGISILAFAEIIKLLNDIKNK